MSQRQEKANKFLGEAQAILNQEFSFKKSINKISPVTSEKTFNVSFAKDDTIPFEYSLQSALNNIVKYLPFDSVLKSIDVKEQESIIQILFTID